MPNGRTWKTVGVMTLLAAFGVAHNCEAQLSKNREWNEKLREGYVVERDVIYSQADSASNRLDVYVPKSAGEKRPVLMWFHGGGWRNGSKDSVSSQLLPYLRMGWTVVNVEYRLARAALAPAAVIDCRCALGWIFTNASAINADLSKIVASGSSAGGHLALMAGMLPAGSELDKECGHAFRGGVAAVVNFYGITDLHQLLSGPDEKSYSVAWIGDGPDRVEVAGLVSPLKYVRSGLPPVLTIHGNNDPTVPYVQAVRLHAALDSVGVPNRLLTIDGGGHGRFGTERNREIEREIVQFLSAQKIIEKQ